MAVFDVNNPPTQPDSELDPDLSLETAFNVEGGEVMIAPGDWVDVDPAYMGPDQYWGFSYQVCQVYPEAQAVGILVIVDQANQQYAETQLSAMAITNNFRKVAKL